VYNASANRATLLHTDQRIEFDDIFPSDPRYEQIQARTHQACVLGDLLDLIRVNPTKEGYEKVFLFASHDRVKLLAEERDGVEQNLCKEQIEKEIEQKIDGQTLLELLEDEIDRCGKEADTRQKRREMWTLSETFLERILAEQDEAIGLASEEYQDHVQLVNTFREYYKLERP